MAIPTKQTTEEIRKGLVEALKIPYDPLAWERIFKGAPQQVVWSQACDPTDWSGAENVAPLPAEPVTQVTQEAAERQREVTRNWLRLKLETLDLSPDLAAPAAEKAANAEAALLAMEWGAPVLMTGPVEEALRDAVMDDLQRRLDELERDIFLSLAVKNEYLINRCRELVPAGNPLDIMAAIRDIARGG